jgi:hypothetical protein
MDVAWFFETLVTMYDITRYHEQEAHRLIFHIYEDDKSFVVEVFREEGFPIYHERIA